MTALLKEIDAAFAALKTKVEAAIAANPKKAVLVSLAVGFVVRSLI
jgi:hypothetical protein